LTLNEISDPDGRKKGKPKDAAGSSGGEGRRESQRKAGRDPTISIWLGS